MEGNFPDVVDRRCGDGDPVRLPDGRLHPKAIGGPGAKIGYVLTWMGIVPKWMPSAGGGLFVSDLADGPPTDGSVFWYVTDETC